MRVEILTAILEQLTGSSALTTALGDSEQIYFGWASESIVKYLSQSKPVALFWGADISSGGQVEHGNAASVKEPDMQVSFHLFAYDVEAQAAAAEALLELFTESTLSTDEYKVHRIQRAGDVLLYESEHRLHHRIVSFSFSEIFKVT